jgi:hypothetical protein
MDSSKKLPFPFRRKNPARAKNSEGAAGGGAAPEHSKAEDRVNTLKFNIFRKPSA